MRRNEIVEIVVRLGDDSLLQGSRTLEKRDTKKCASNADAL